MTMSKDPSSSAMLAHRATFSLKGRRNKIPSPLVGEGQGEGVL